MVIFHSYVSLPEGITIVITIFGGLTADLPEMAMERERESNSDHIQEIPRVKSLELC